MTFLMSCPAACASLLVASPFGIDAHLASNYYQVSPDILFWLPDTVAKVAKQSSSWARKSKVFLTFLFGSFHFLHCVCCSASSCFCLQPVALLDFSQNIRVSNCNVVSSFISPSSDPPSLSSACLLSHTAYASVLICVYYITHASFFSIYGWKNFTVNCVHRFIYII